MDEPFKIGLLIGVFAIAIVLFQYSQNGRYQYSPNGNVGVIVDTRTGEFWTEEGSHFEPRTGHITTHLPSVDDETGTDERTIKFRNCLQDAVANRKSARDWVAEQKSALQPEGAKSSVSSTSTSK